MDKPGDLPRDFDQWTAEQRGHSATPAAQPPTAPGPVPSTVREGFTLESGGGKAFAGAAERTGNIHRLEVVHPADSGGPREHSGQPPPEDDLAARMMHGIEEAVADIRRHAAGRLISLARPSEPELQDPGDGLQTFLSQMKLRARRLAAKKPLKSIAAVIAAGLALGAALRLRRSHR
jgi:hypothetical protein